MFIDIQTHAMSSPSAPFTYSDVLHVVLGHVLGRNSGIPTWYWKVVKRVPDLRTGRCAGALILGSEDTRRDSVTDLPDVRPRVVSTRPVALW